MTSQSSQMYNTVALYNAKGGVGKTTIGINVAGALNEHGHDVLFVDLDPQGNATEGLGMVDAYDAEPPNLYNVVTDQESADALNDLVLEHPEMDLIPSNVDMLTAERELTIADYEGEDALSNLDHALVALDGDYDYMLIDSPPFFGEVSDAALYAARNVIVPALTESTSQRAVELLLDQIERLEETRDIHIREVAAVANRIESTNEGERMQQWIETAFPDVPVFRIRKRVALQRAYSAGVSIFEHDESSDMSDRFLDVAEALDEQFQEVPADV